MIRRPRRSLPAAVLALVLLAAAVLVAHSCIQLLLHQNPLIPFDALAEYAANLRWNDPVSIAAGVAAAVLGLILLTAALVPGKPTVLPLSTEGGRTSAGVSRRSLRRDLTTTAADADGISSAAVRVRPRRIVATVRTPAADTSAMPEKVHRMLDERLTDIDLASRPQLRIRVSPDRSST
jgi:Family of unknown function (DUF6286)